ncbi:MAG TPA: DUF3617 family protein [Allosphingosinicella sp.]|nr:DUF3617 family protein [Allosphingosinicella sp.]
MSRPAFALPLALLLPLAAAAPAAVGASLEDFSRAVGMKKGLWHTRVTVTAAEIRPSPTADPAHLAEVRAQIEAKIGVAEEKDECLPAASPGGPRLPGILLEPDCSYSRLRAAGGRWSLNCAVATDDEMASMDSEGTYSRKAVTGRHEGDITRKGVVLHLKAETESRWVGKCNPPKTIDVTADGD